MGPRRRSKGLVDTEDQRAVAAVQVLEQQRQQDAGRRTGRPHRPIEHLMVAGVVALVAAAHDPQCCRHGALARGQDRAHQQHLGFPPGWVGKQCCEGNENGYNGIGQGEHSWTFREKWGQAILPCSYVFSIFCVKSSKDVVTYAGSDPDAGVTLTWSVSGTDKDHFTIDSTGKLSFSIRPNHEMPDDAFESPDTDGDNDYEIVVEVSDGLDETGSAENPAVVDNSINVSVTATNVDETPEVPAGVDDETFVEIEYDATTAAGLWTNRNCHGAAASDPWGRPEGWASDMGTSW